ncbi:MAG: hypothetical protein HYX71_02520 [Opitutae bacterium]|nr:hypothetical protein [Opitutae bacterium]
MKKILVPVLLLLLLAGCSSSNTITVGLKVELTNIARSQDGATQVSWRIVNPNIASYLVDETTHRIFLNGTLIGTIHEKEAVAIPAQNHASRATRLNIAGAGGERALADALAAGSAAYRTDSIIVIRLYGDSTDKSSLTSSGKVTVTAK